MPASEKSSTLPTDPDKSESDTKNNTDNADDDNGRPRHVQRGITMYLLSNCSANNILMCI